MAIDKAEKSRLVEYGIERDVWTGTRTDRAVARGWWYYREAVEIAIADGNWAVSNPTIVRRVRDSADAPWGEWEPAPDRGPDDTEDPMSYDRSMP